MHAAVTSLGHVGLMTCGLLALASHRVFNVVFTEGGPEHYAERPASWWPYAETLPMPFNTVINLGYVVVGILWICRVYYLERQGVLSKDQGALFYPLCWMAIFYGPIQLARILTQSQYWAVLDQWYTLPCFAWAAIWAFSVLENECSLHHHTTTCSECAGSKSHFRWRVMLASLGSYWMALLHPMGFDFALAIHIPISVYYGCRVFFRHRTGDTKYCFVMCLVSVSMFVFLKLADKPLGTMHPVFTVISGHFISKIGDVMQVHYCMLFFLSVAMDQSKQKHK